ncbi:transmembrane protease serine 9-like [Diachasmimorpha longicaudata]|uniref:transmembrane protease serine 9-like n=1 Tax=Diachasmimorpha longicaudata TaxID=58733 RepID=UPI0030B8D3C7
MELSLILLVVAAILNNAVNAGRIKRIVGGSRVDIQSAPFVAMLRDYRDDDARTGHICGGAIISSRHILTAAHCISEGDRYPLDLDELDNLVIVVGEDTFDYHSTMYEVEEIYHPTTFHGDLSDTSKDRGDIAIIKLEEEIHFNSYRQPIQLATHEPESQARGLVYGWGRTGRNAPYSGSLQGLQVTYFTMPSCSWEFPFQAFTADELCARGIGETDTCSGDSGAPLVMSHQLVGVLSHGSVGCDGSRPSAYASVPYYKSWIEDVIAGKVERIYPPVIPTSPPDVRACHTPKPATTAPRRHRASCIRKKKKKSSSTPQSPKNFM